MRTKCLKQVPLFGDDQLQNFLELLLCAKQGPPFLPHIWMDKALRTIYNQ